MGGEGVSGELDVGNRISRAEMLTAGVAAWLALNAIAYAAARLLGVPWGTAARFLGSLLLPGAGQAAQVWTGRALFLLAALGWSLLYPWASRRLSGPGWWRGAVFGAGIWFLSGLLLPLLGALHPGAGGSLNAASGATGIPFPGLLGLGFAGGSGVLLSVLAHQAFGITLGTLTALQEDKA